jgi:hypothetical protein
VLGSAGGVKASDGLAVDLLRLMTTRECMRSTAVSMKQRVCPCGKYQRHAAAASHSQSMSVKPARRDRNLATSLAETHLSARDFQIHTFPAKISSRSTQWDSDATSGGGHWRQPRHRRRCAAAAPLPPFSFPVERSLRLCSCGFGSDWGGDSTGAAAGHPGLHGVCSCTGASGCRCSAGHRRWHHPCGSADAGVLPSGSNQLIDCCGALPCLQSVRCDVTRPEDLQALFTVRALHVAWTAPRSATLLLEILTPPHLARRPELC